jgi:hypothetical protein
MFDFFKKKTIESKSLINNDEIYNMNFLFDEQFSLFEQDPEIKKYVEKREKIKSKIKKINRKKQVNKNNINYSQAKLFLKLSSEYRHEATIFCDKQKYIQSISSLQSVLECLKACI